MYSKHKYPDMNGRQFYIFEGHPYKMFLDFVSKNNYPFTLHQDFKYGFRRAELKEGLSLSEINAIRFHWLEFLAANPAPHEKKLVVEMAAKIAKNEEWKLSVIIENSESTQSFTINPTNP